MLHAIQEAPDDHLQCLDLVLFTKQPFHCLFAWELYVCCNAITNPMLKCFTESVYTCCDVIYCFAPDSGSTACKCGGAKVRSLAWCRVSTTAASCSGRTLMTPLLWLPAPLQVLPCVRASVCLCLCMSVRASVCSSVYFKQATSGPPASHPLAPLSLALSTSSVIQLLLLQPLG